MNKQSNRFLALVAFATICGGTSFSQSTWWVDAGATAPGDGTPANPYTSIHYAVHQPNVENGDLVLVLPGRYEETVEIVDKYLTLRSTAGALDTVIDAMGQGTTMTVVAPLGKLPGVVLIEGFTITGGTGTWRAGVRVGGGVLAEGVQLSLERSIVRANRAALGGGIAADDTYLGLYDVELEDNVAETELGLANGKGGALFARNAGQVSTFEVRMRDNVAGLGGGIHAQDVGLNLIDSQILANQARGETFDGIPAQGGGVFAANSEVLIEGSRIGENLAFGPNTLGGGLRLCEGTTTQIQATLVDQNAAGDWRHAGRDWRAFGGGIASGLGLVAEDLELRANHATWGGGGYYGAGELRDVLVAGNSAHLGGGLYTDFEISSVDGGCFAGSLYVENGAILENEAFALGAQFGEGGGVFGPAFLTGSKLSANKAYGNGGGARGATLFDSEVVGNAAVGFGDVPAYGGGAANATLVLTQVYDNEAPFGGGAANSFLSQVTVYGNRGSCDCGGLFFSHQGSVDSSIVWGNYPHQIVDLLGVSVKFSTVQHGWPGATNTGLNPMFWYPESNDFHLRPGSYCIDNGNPSVLDPDGSPCDMGGLIFDANWCGVPESYCAATVNSQGCTPAIDFTGSPTLTGADDFVVSARNLINNKAGFLVWGYNPGELPFGGSTLCIQGPRIRTPVQNTGGNPGAPDCSGTMSYHLTQEYMDDHFLWFGRSIFAQFIYRDPALSDGFGATEGLRVIICK